MNRYENDFDWLSDRPEHSERELLEWCAGISDRAAAKLQRLQSAEADAKAKARHDRELLEFVAAITGKPEHERRLRELIEKEAEEREASRREEAFHERHVADVTEWNPDQPRVPEGSPQGGQWDDHTLTNFLSSAVDLIIPFHNEGATYEIREVWFGADAARRGESAADLLAA